MIIVVGEKLGSGGTRAHLARLLDQDETAMMEPIAWLNLWEYPGTRPETYVAMILLAAGEGDLIVMLGRRVARAFWQSDLAPLETVARIGGPTFLALPHPSGLNRWYNDPDHAEDARVVLRALWRKFR